MAWAASPDPLPDSGAERPRNCRAFAACCIHSRGPAEEHLIAPGALAAVLALGACAMHDIPKEQASLHGLDGGRAAIEAVVGQFLQNVVADDRINSFFANVDAAALQMNLVDQICEASGGPSSYSGGDMATAHKGPGITDDYFSALVGDLVAALDNLDLPEREKSEPLAALGPMKGDIVDS